MTSLEKQKFSLKYLKRYDIRNEAEGLNEPSGLALSGKKNALWTVSDDRNKIFKLSFKGELKKKKSFQVNDAGLEGIALGPTGEFLFIVREDTNEIIKVNIDKQKASNRRKLSEMKGYEKVEKYFSGGKKNKGLEGVTYNKKTGTIFVLKEGSPGLLLELSSDLKKIINYRLLNEKNGFSDTDVKPDKLDFSGICYDQTQKIFWIVSDKAKKLFLYDWKKNKVAQNAVLYYEKNGKKRKIKKVEGVAVNPNAKRLYVVSDEKAKLYAYRYKLSAGEH